MAKALNGRSCRAKWRRRRNTGPDVKEFFFDDDTFNIQKARTVELCDKLKPLDLTWSLHVARDHRLRDAEGAEGSRLPLLIVGYESGDPQILKNIKKGATVERARQFTKDCQEARAHRPRRFHSWTAGRDPRVDPQHDRFRQRAGCGDDPGLDRARVSGNRVLRLRQEERIHHEHEADGGRRRTPGCADRVSGSSARAM